MPNFFNNVARSLPHRSDPSRPRSSQVGDRRRRSVWDASCPSRVLIIDDHPLLAEGLELALSAREWEAQTLTSSTPTPSRTSSPPLSTSRPTSGCCSTTSSGVRSSQLVDLVAPLAGTGAIVVMLTARASWTELRDVSRGWRRVLGEKGRFRRRARRGARARPPGSPATRADAAPTR